MVVEGEGGGELLFCENSNLPLMPRSSNIGLLPANKPRRKMEHRHLHCGRADPRNINPRCSSLPVALSRLCQLKGK